MSFQTPAGISNKQKSLFKSEKRSNSILIGNSNYLPPSLTVTNNPSNYTQKSPLDDNSLPIISKYGSNLLDRIFLNEINNPEP